MPTYAHEAGVKDFNDLAKFADKFGKKIYGIGSGSPANDYIRQMITGNEFGPATGSWWNPASRRCWFRLAAR